MEETAERLLKVLVEAAPFLAGGAKLTKSSWEQARRIYERLKSWLIKARHYDILGKLEGFLRQPEELQDELREELLKLLKEDKAFAEEVQQFLKAPALQEIVTSRATLSEFIQEQKGAWGKQSINAEDVWKSKFRQTMSSPSSVESE